MCLCGCSDKNTYSVFYDLNGGMVLEELSTQISNESSYILPVAYKSGCRFVGWYNNEHFFGDAITEIPVGNRSDYTLYAKFLEVYSISYYSDGGTNLNTATEITNEDSLQLLPAKKDGYIFLGWYGDNMFSGSEQNVLSGVNNNVNLYAKFGVAHSISYDLQGGINNTNNPVQFCAEQSFILETPTKAGYSFVAWYDENTNTRVSSISLGTDRDVYLRAEWELGIYNISWDLQGGYSSVPYPTQYTFGVGVTEEKFIIPTKNNMIFGGWYIERDNSTVQISSIKTSDYGDMKIYAKWIDAVVLLQDNCWNANSTSNNGYCDVANVKNAVTITVPNELMYLYNQNKLGLEITGTFYANVRAQGNCTATAVAYMIVNETEYSVCSVSAKGGGYPLSGGFVTPANGSWSYSGNVPKTVKFTLTTNEVNIGYKYYMYSNQENSKVTNAMQYCCVSLVCKFYIVS